MRIFAILAPIPAVTLAVTFGVVPIGSASAQSEPNPNALFAAHPTHELIASGFDLPHVSPEWTPVDGSTGGWTSFLDAVGRGWIKTPDATFGSPRWIIGPGHALSPDGSLEPLDADAAIERARDLITRIAPSLGIDDLGGLEFWHATPTRTAGGHTLLGIDYRQTHRGFVVRTLRETRRVRVRVDLTIGRIAAFGSDWIRGLDVDTTGAMDRDAAVEHARALLPAYAPGTGEVHAVDTYILVGFRHGATLARLVHQVEIRTVSPPHLWRVIFDARNGDRLFLADTLRHVDVVGNVSLGSLDGRSGSPPNAPFSVKPAPYLFVSIPGGNRATTDASGNFRIAHGGTAQVKVTGGLKGQYCTVSNSAGADTSFSRNATPGTPANIVVNGSHSSEFKTAEANGYHWVNAVHAMVRKRIPTFNALTRQQTNVNVFFPFGCNAWFDGQAINFTRSSGGCNNMAFAEIIAHEWGHAFHQWFAGSISNGAFSEGIGDHLALYLTDQRMLGRGIQFARDYRRPNGGACCTNWPASQHPSPHKGGEIWAGTMMDMRDQLVTRHGATAGKDLSEKLAIPQYARKPSGMPAALMETMLQDDNDANLTNGSPNFAQIWNAASMHKLPRPPAPTIASLVAQTTKPPIGSTLNLSLDAYKRANASWGAAFSLAKGSPTIPGVGQLGIALPIYPLRTGVTDAWGAAKFSVFIPRVSVLRGTRLHTQAVVVGSPNMISSVWTIDIQ